MQIFQAIYVRVQMPESFAEHTLVWSPADSGSGVEVYRTNGGTLTIGDGTFASVGTIGDASGVYSGWHTTDFPFVVQSASTGALQYPPSMIAHGSVGFTIGLAAAAFFVCVRWMFRRFTELGSAIG